ncbi:radical SAM protein [Amycolatopsis sp. NPDC051758]|uniref:radical SAM protein n=1 Tax=Amycolatopsis sp. NPDC051758 TaxID=3363935 RepID=UPI00379A178B
MHETRRPDAFRITEKFAELLTSHGLADNEQLLRAALKFEILANGVRPTARAAERLNLGSPQSPSRPRRTRSGVSGGLDLDFGSGIFVNAPVLERYATDSLIELDFRDGFVLTWPSGGISVSVLPPPHFYGRPLDGGGQPLEKVAQMCSGDRLCFGITGPGCSFWPAAERCAYCSIGMNREADMSKKTTDELLQVVDAAVADPARPARHLLLGGGTPRGDDMGASICARLTRLVKAKHDLPVYVMIAAPLQDASIRELADAGVDELGMNLEFWTEESWRTIIPGKNRRIGKDRYLKALEYAGEVFGPVRARSIVIVGLEHRSASLQAVTELASRNVMPILSPFRPLDGTTLQDSRGFDGPTYQDLYADAVVAAAKFGLPVGPTCLPCQNNVLALPV